MHYRFFNTFSVLKDGSYAGATLDRPLLQRFGREYVPEPAPDVEPRPADRSRAGDQEWHLWRLGTSVHSNVAKKN